MGRSAEPPPLGGEAPSNVDLVMSVCECIHPEPQRKQLLADRTCTLRPPSTALAAPKLVVRAVPVSSFGFWSLLQPCWRYTPSGVTATAKEYGIIGMCKRVHGSSHVYVVTGNRAKPDLLGIACEVVAVRAAGHQKGSHLTDT